MLTGRYRYEQKTCIDYGWTYMLSPDIAAYRDPNGPSVVLVSSFTFYPAYLWLIWLQHVMRSLGVEGVPPVHETGRCDQVEQIISKALTNCRAHIKLKVRWVPYLLFHVLTAVSTLIRSLKLSLNHQRFQPT